MPIVTCPFCGRPTDDGLGFCAHCHAPLAAGAPPKQQAAPSGKPAACPAGLKLPLEAIQLENPERPFSLTSGAISEAWGFFKQKPGELIVMFFILGLLNFNYNFTGRDFQGLDIGKKEVIVLMVVLGSVMLFIRCAFFLLQAPLKGGSIIFWLRLIRGQEARFGHFGKGFRMFLPLVGTQLLAGLAVVGGLILLVVPGIIIGLGLTFATHLVVDKNLAYADALKASWRLTNGYKADLFVLALLAGLLNIGGFLCCCVGLLVTVPVTAGAFAVAYNRLAQAGNAYLELG